MGEALEEMIKYQRKRIEVFAATTGIWNAMLHWEARIKLETLLEVKEKFNAID